MLFIQEIVTTWTKQSRGGEGAVTRNAIPERFPLPSLFPLSKEPLSLLHQRILLSESNGFQARETTENSTIDPKARERFKGLWITPQDDGYLLQYAWNAGVGAPIRQRYPRTIGVLQSGQWAQVKLNGRFSCEVYWYYHKTVYNVGLIAGNTDVQTIFTQVPAYTYDAMAELW